MTTPTFTPEVIEALFVDLIGLGVDAHLVFVHAEGTTATEITLELLSELATGAHLAIFDEVPTETVILSVTGGTIELDGDEERIRLLPLEEQEAEIAARIDAAGDEAGLFTYALVGDLDTRSYLLARRSTIGLDSAEIVAPFEPLDEVVAHHDLGTIEGDFARFVSLLADRRNSSITEETS